MTPDHLTPAAVRARVRRSTRASGVPERVEDRTAAEQIAHLVESSSTSVETLADRRAS